jgi:GNAT superfamily N-acetyltransferase
MIELDNPFHAALASLHAPLAVRAGRALRYPSAHAPFLGVAAAGIDVDADLVELVQSGEAVYLLGVLPRIPAGWTLQSFRPLAQMICPEPVALPDGPDPILLDARHRDDVLALTALVYPHYFRARTMELGRYFGLYVDGRLAAMIGERLGSAGTRELSAICTHPDFHGRGYARRLTALLANDILVSGRVPFLHVSYENTRAKSLYETLGFRLRTDIGFFSLQRP